MNTRLKVLLATGTALVVPGLVSAQDPPPTPRVLYACYQPSAGVVYRIREPGLPTECRSPVHIMFSWNESGPPGSPGSPGAAGERGPAGLACWDTNGNGVADAAEDKNGDHVWDALDCAGAAGPAGPPGLSGRQVVSQRRAAPNTGNLDFVSVQATCPSPKVPIGGGGSIMRPYGDWPDAVAIVYSIPYNDGWLVLAVETEQRERDWEVVAYAVCALVQ